jgi:hypothetical protein
VENICRRGGRRPPYRATMETHREAPCMQNLTTSCPGHAFRLLCSCRLSAGVPQVKLGQTLSSTALTNSAHTVSPYRHDWRVSKVGDAVPGTGGSRGHTCKGPRRRQCQRSCNRWEVTHADRLSQQAAHMTTLSGRWVIRCENAKTPRRKSSISVHLCRTAIKSAPYQAQI